MRQIIIYINKSESIDNLSTFKWVIIYYACLVYNDVRQAHALHIIQKKYHFVLNGDR